MDKLILYQITTKKGVDYIAAKDCNEATYKYDKIHKYKGQHIINVCCIIDNFVNKE